MENKRTFTLSDLNDKEYHAVEIDPPSEEIQHKFRTSNLLDAQTLAKGEPGTWVQWEDGSIGWLPKSKQIEITREG